MASINNTRRANAGNSKPAKKSAMLATIATASLFASALFLAGCQSSKSQAFDINTYQPVIDREDAGFDSAKYEEDLVSCRKIAAELQARYEERLKEQKSKRRIAGLLSTATSLVGAAGIGSAASAGAQVGSAATSIAGSAVSSGINSVSGVGSVSDQMAENMALAMDKFGPVGAMDQCVKERGYKVYSSPAIDAIKKLAN